MDEHLQEFSQALLKEFIELKKLGIKVPRNAIKNAKNSVYLTIYEDMSHSPKGIKDCADLLMASSGIS